LAIGCTPKSDRPLSVDLYGISAPKATPPEIADIPNKAVGEALRDPKLLAFTGASVDSAATPGNPTGNRYHRACPGDPRLTFLGDKTWMAGTSPAMMMERRRSGLLSK
jgi:hypothetical protein